MSQFYCSVCELDCENDGAFQSHNLGKRHLSRLAEKKNSKGSEEASPEAEVPSLRPYEVEAFTAAIDRNIILHLPTGFGESFVALHVTKHFLNTDKKRGTLFLVSTRMQARDTLQQLQRVKVNCISVLGGASSTKSETSFKMGGINVALVSTPEVMYSTLERMWWTPEEFSLIVMDDCVVGGNDSMSKFVSSYNSSLKDARTKPHILALTSVFFGEASGSKFEPLKFLLEQTVDAKVFTPHLRIDFERNNRVNRIFFENNSGELSQTITSTVLPVAKETGVELHNASKIVEQSHSVGVAVGLVAIIDYLNACLRESGCSRDVLNACNQKLHGLTEKLEHCTQKDFTQSHKTCPPVERVEAGRRPGDHCGRIVPSGPQPC